MVQFAPAASVSPQVFVWVKLDAFVPPSVMLEIVIVAAPVLLSFTVEAALVVAIVVTGNAIVDADSVATGTAPAPVSATVCGEPVALSATLSVPVTVPAATGVKLTEIVQFAPAASVVPQVVAVCVNVALPPIEIAIPVSVPVPGFDSVTVCAPAELLSAAEKLSDDGDSTACGTGTGAAPVPLTVTVWVEPATPPVLSVTVRLAV